MVYYYVKLHILFEKTILKLLMMSNLLPELNICFSRFSQSADVTSAAQEAAAKINCQFGIEPNLMMQPQKPGPHPGMGMVTTEEHRVPDKMVGLSEWDMFCCLHCYFIFC